MENSNNKRKNKDKVKKDKSNQKNIHNPFAKVKCIPYDQK